LILDTSAVLAIVHREEGHLRLSEAILGADLVGAGTPTLAETGIVLESRFPGQGRTMLERFLDEAHVEEIPFGELHWLVALEAFERFGKGRHPARLNLGDCFGYASAKVAGDTLLYVGDDFAKTDIPPAI
jgi:ribonuclease VapC